VSRPILTKFGTLYTCITHPIVVVVVVVVVAAAVVVVVVVVVTKTTLLGRNTLRVFENRVLRRIFGPRR
jgi:hypothetical protein